MYRKETPMNLKLGQIAPSKFAENNLSKEIYINKDRKTLVKNMVDVCRQYMNRDLENDLSEEIRFYNSMNDDDDKIGLEYHCEMYETVKTFNDMLSILFLHFSNIISYPNETFYERYKSNNIRIRPEDAIRIANKICGAAQEVFEDLSLCEKSRLELIEIIRILKKKLILIWKRSTQQRKAKVKKVIKDDLTTPKQRK